ncbi:hypothetical protein QL996_04595 [Planococcus sp. APC 4015]|nr:hypothetical protein [Planococcus sp. APC 4015]
MRILASTAASVVLALTLVGCSTSPPADTGKTPDTAPVASASPSPSPTESEPPAVDAEFGERVMSTRGNLVKDIGQLAGVSAAEGDLTLARFAVTDIVLDTECTSGFADPAANGHYVGIHLNVETAPELAQEEFPWVSFTQYDWQAYDTDGKRLNDPVGNAWSCLDSGQQLPSQIGPGQSVSGWIVLDVAARNGFLVLAAGGSPTGWEWSY